MMMKMLKYSGISVLIYWNYTDRISKLDTIFPFSWRYPELSSTFRDLERKYRRVALAQSESKDALYPPNLGVLKIIMNFLEKITEFESIISRHFLS